MAAEETKLDVASKGSKDKGAEYKCVTKCYWNGRLYRENDVVVFTEDVKDIPEHFEKVK